MFECRSPRSELALPSGRRISPPDAGVPSVDSGNESAHRSGPSPAAESPALSNEPFSLTG